MRKLSVAIAVTLLSGLLISRALAQEVGAGQGPLPFPAPSPFSGPPAGSGQPLPSRQNLPATHQMPPGQSGPDRRQQEVADDVAAPAEELAVPPARPSIDAGLAARGQVAFNKSCIACHEADKALSKHKSLGQWRATVQRMACKDGADVPLEDIAPISVYLASLSGGAGGEGLPPGNAGNTEVVPGGDVDLSEPPPGLAVYGTLSPTWRGGNDNLQNPGFLPDTWVGVGFQANPVLSGRATACLSCHTEPGEGSRIELVDAVMRLDLAKAFNCCSPQIKSSLESGRFVVPFGAFAQQSNPGVYRTVTKPLIYNMGLRVFDGDLGDPVLPMPYSDEGANFNLSLPIGDGFSANWDAYLVNGLQGTADGIDFDLSRDYVDNNSKPAIGSRLTIGDSQFRLGSSIMAGNAAPTGGVGPAGNSLFYRVYGFDAIFRHEDILRFQFEYARRDSDRIVSIPNPALTRDHVEGYYFETELLLSRSRQISFITRYDRQGRASLAPPPDSSLTTGNFAVSRFTYGLNFVLPGGSLLMINHERWNLPGALNRLEVIGLRWAYSF